MKVTVVLDPAFGSWPSTQLGPAFWMIASPENRALVERLRLSQGFDPNSKLFAGNAYGSAGEAAAAIFGTVADHFPDWAQMEFIGATLDAGLRRSFTDQGFLLTATSRGFVVSVPEACWGG